MSTVVGYLVGERGEISGARFAIPVTGLVGYVALHPSPHIMNHIGIPKFNAKDKLHVRLAKSSAACHAAAPSAGYSDLSALETANGELAAQLWNLSAAELKDIKNSLADLS